MAVIDASVIIAAALSNDPNHKISQKWLISLVRANGRFFAPSIILSEVAGPFGRAYNKPDVARQIVQNLMNGSYAELIPVSIPLAGRAADIAANFKIRGCDAIYVALAEALNEDLITWDKQQRERAKTLVNAYHL